MRFEDRDIKKIQKLNQSVTATLFQYYLRLAFPVFHQRYWYYYPARQMSANTLSAKRYFFTLTKSISQGKLLLIGDGAAFLPRNTKRYYTLRDCGLVLSIELGILKHLFQRPVQGNERERKHV